MSDPHDPESGDGSESGDDDRDDRSGRESGNGRQEQGDQQRGGGQGEGGQQGQGEGGQQPSTAEKVLTGISVVVTLLLFGYVAWHAVQSPSGAQPQVEVVDTERLANESVLVHVEFANAGDQGLLSATAEVTCAQPPPDVTFENVPAGGVKQATLVCPPGTANPDVDVSAWVPT